VRHMGRQPFIGVKPIREQIMSLRAIPLNPVSQYMARALWTLGLLFGIFANALGQSESSACGPLGNTFGPYDYRDHAGSVDFKTNRNNPLFLVESAHFRPEMEALIRGGQGARSDVGPELDYTLRAFPNHHKALDAMVRLSERLKMDPARGARYPVDCWFERSIRFRPDDTIVRMIYAAYLGKVKRLPDAKAQLKFAADTAKDNAFTHYNIGLIYLDMGEFDLALAQAHIAYGLGMQRPELRDKLTSNGQWREAPAVPAEPASAPSQTK